MNNAHTRVRACTQHVYARARMHKLTHAGSRVGMRFRRGSEMYEVEVRARERQQGRSRDWARDRDTRSEGQIGLKESDTLMGS